MSILNPTESDRRSTVAGDGFGTDVPEGKLHMGGVSIRNLTKTFDNGVVAVDDLSLDIAAGEFVTLLGPSGCGKTTTLRCLAGLETANEGEIRFEDQVVFSAERGIELPPERRGAGMVFQSYAVWPHLSVFSNVAYPLRTRGVPRPEIGERVHAMLRAVDLQGLEERVPSMLSGGQQQRVALARAMVGRNRLLLFDEPLSNLDAKLRASMRVELRNLHAQVQTTSVYVTHDQLEAMVLSDRVVVMRSGQVQQVATPEEVFTQPANRFVAAFVGFNNFLPATIRELAQSAVIAQVGPGGPLLTCAYRDGLEVGQEIELGIRGNRCQLSRSPFGDNTNVMQATVADTVYLGDVEEFMLEVGGLELKVSQEHDAGGDKFEVGDTAYVRMPERWLIPLDE